MLVSVTASSTGIGICTSIDKAIVFILALYCRRLQGGFHHLQRLSHPYPAAIKDGHMHSTSYHERQECKATQSSRERWATVESNTIFVRQDETFDAKVNNLGDIGAAYPPVCHDILKVSVRTFDTANIGSIWRRKERLRFTRSFNIQRQSQPRFCLRRSREAIARTAPAFVCRNPTSIADRDGPFADPAARRPIRCHS